MLVKNMIYFLCLLIFLFSICILVYSIIHKNRKASKYIIVLSIINIIYLAIDLSILPGILSLDIGFEILLFYGIAFISVIIFLISIIVTSIRLRKLNRTGKSAKYLVSFIILTLFPIFLFCFSYFREMYYINDSSLIIVCTSGEEFSEHSYSYAISDDYIKEFTIGADFRGFNIEKYLPSGFHAFNYPLETEIMKYEDNNIVIYRNDRIVYKIKPPGSIMDCDKEKIFYKR